MQKLSLAWCSIQILDGVSIHCCVFNQSPFFYSYWLWVSFLLSHFKTCPNYSILYTFKCLCFVHLPTLERHKLRAQFVKCSILGYSLFLESFVCYYISGQRFCISKMWHFWMIKLYFLIFFILQLMLLFFPLFSTLLMSHYFFLFFYIFIPILIVHSYVIVIC